jgi:hypothetical protein
VERRKERKDKKKFKEGKPGEIKGRLKGSGQNSSKHY